MRITEFINRINNINAKKYISEMPVFFIAAGVLVRVFQYIHNRSLWLDEAMLARNIISRDFIGLLTPLDFNQGAPVLFLWLIKSSSVFFGTNEHALRLFPLLASIAGIFLFYLIAKSFLEERFALAALFLFAFSTRLIYYAQELKQYSFDVTIVLALLYLTIKICNNRNNYNQIFVFITLIGCISTYLSFPSIFAIASSSTTILILKIRNKIKISYFHIVMMFTLWGIAFSINYFAILRPLAQNDYLFSFWSKGFLPLPINVEAIKIWGAVITNFFTYFEIKNISQIPIIVFSGIAVIAGVRNKSEFTLTLAATILFAMMASMLGKYPLEKRMALFAFPVIILLAAKGAETIAANKNTYISLALVLLMMTPTISNIPKTMKGITREEVRDILQSLDSKIQNEDSVYVYSRANHAVRYYKRNEILDNKTWHFGLSTSNETNEYIDSEINSINNKNRVWFIFSHINKKKEKIFVSRINGTLVEKIKKEGASLYLYRFE